MTLIPYTLEKTTLTDKKVGDRVNVEADILGKYVEKLLRQEDGKSGGVDVSLLREYGFIKGE
jgi:riboflavin synthase